MSSAIAFNKTHAFLGKVFPEYINSESYIPEILLEKIQILEKKEQENQTVINAMMKTIEMLTDTVEKREIKLKKELDTYKELMGLLIPTISFETNEAYPQLIKCLLINKHYDEIRDILHKDFSLPKKRMICDILLRQKKDVRDEIDIEIIRDILKNIKKEYIFHIFGTNTFDGYGDKEYMLNRIDEVYRTDKVFKIGDKIYYKKRKNYGEIIEIDQDTDSYTVKLENGIIVDTIREYIN